MLHLRYASSSYNDNRQFIFAYRGRLPVQLNHSDKKGKYSLEIQAELAVLCSYVENQVMLEPFLLYRSSKSKQTKKQDSKACLWAHIFTFL